ncbi:hypothetical protein [Rossellomorea sp. SC111]|uniref:hypothetical protein n=1 Tax=Rossellomorea sp. SC111 TaxID=2968985 RepID=UPI00215A391F|nr:hypothetical protein [Rossellomorea sp. SC111]
MLFSKEAYRFIALSNNVCWMVRGTASLSADEPPSLLSFASGFSARPFFRRSLRSSPHHLYEYLVTELKGVNQVIYLY